MRILYLSKTNPLEGLRFRDHHASNWVRFEAGSQLTALQYESTEALNLHLKGFTIKKAKCLCSFVTTSIKWIFLFMFFRSKAHAGKVRQQT